MAVLYQLDEVSSQSPPHLPCIPVDEVDDRRPRIVDDIVATNF